MFLADALRASCPQGVASARCVTLGIPRAYIPQDKPDRILARLGLDADGLARTVRGALEARTPPAEWRPDVGDRPAVADVPDRPP